ncbi:MAG TPA: ABC transporter substrate-binding protein [Thermoleophilia bacterium]
MSTTRIGRLTAALLLSVTLAVGVIALNACGSGSTGSTASSYPSAAASAAGPITVTDDSGMQVTLDQAATRIVSLAPANTEIAYAIGTGDKMVAGTSYDDYPAEAKALPKIGDFANPNIEKIASYSPDLVLAAGGIQDKLRSKLEALGMKVYVVDPKTYDGTIATIENVGKLAGTEAGATAVADKMTAAEKEVQAKVSGLTPASTFLEIYSKPLMTAGSGTFIDDMITIAGGENIGAQAGAGFPNFSTEVLVKDDPQVYIADSGSMSAPGDIKTRAGFADLTAVKDGHVYVIEDSIIARPGPRLAQGLVALAGMIHPEASAAQ